MARLTPEMVEFTRVTNLTYKALATLLGCGHEQAHRAAVGAYPYADHKGAAPRPPFNKRQPLRRYTDAQVAEIYVIASNLGLGLQEAYIRHVVPAPTRTLAEAERAKWAAEAKFPCLTVEQVAYIRDHCHLSAGFLARKYGCSVSTIRNARAGNHPYDQVTSPPPVTCQKRTYKDGKTGKILVKGKRTYLSRRSKGSLGIR